MKPFKAIAPLCIVATLVCAQSAFVAQNVHLYATASDGSALGELIVASQVNVLSQKGEFTEVEFVGFMPEGSTKAYEKIGMLMVGFEAPTPSTYKVIGQKKDEYESIWLNVSVKGFVKTKALKETKASILEEGKAAFQAKCGTCHALHPEGEFEANVWPSILEAMSPQAGLSSAERYSIEKYLQNYQH